MTEQGKPVLLTEAEAKVLWQASFSQHAKTFKNYCAELRERGLMEPEPVLTDEDHAWQVCADHGYRFRNSREHQLATAALRRGMELRPELTREKVRKAYNRATEAWTSLDTPERFTELLHAALTDGGRDVHS